MSKKPCPLMTFRMHGKELGEQPTKPLDIDKAAVFLIRKFGEDSASVAYSRAYCCRCRGDNNAAQEWNAVLNRIVALLFSPREGPLH
ncbi:protein of unknown function [Candidatus Filomicrobium marinum]|uniref:Uncharacterized protein n=2 Tax=Filomicrobium TaxID=119044 RepID=A0A0D6JGC1_9HYPH|nr:protein of unknown function [Candidatus Filomicrobium marinum]CPR19360.1 protein of unknown function [Candidatus Filomicrobium marinum]SDO08236.1 hypothetical protein SAMN04488061_0209 [Filomicrobium insigne]